MLLAGRSIAKNLLRSCKRSVNGYDFEATTELNAAMIDQPLLQLPTVSSRLRRRKLMRPAVGHGVALLPKTFQRLCVHLRCTSILACESMQETTTPSNLGAEDNATYSIQYEWQTREVEFHNVRSLIRRICFSAFGHCFSQSAFWKYSRCESCGGAA